MVCFSRCFLANSIPAHLARVGWILISPDKSGPEKKYGSYEKDSEFGFYRYKTWICYLETECSCCLCDKDRLQHLKETQKPVIPINKGKPAFSYALRRKYTPFFFKGADKNIAS